MVGEQAFSFVEFRGQQQLAAGCLVNPDIHTLLGGRLFPEAAVAEAVLEGQFAAAGSFSCIDPCCGC